MQRAVESYCVTDRHQEDLYEERVKLFEKYADVTVCEDGLELEETIEKCWQCRQIMRRKFQMLQKTLRKKYKKYFTLAVFQMLCCCGTHKGVLLSYL